MENNNELLEVNNKIIQYWDSQARRYDAVRMNIREDTAFLEDFFSRFEPGRRLRVLDMGSGCGYSAIKVAQLGHSVRGIDLSCRMLENARYNAEKAGVDIAFEEKDITCTGYPSCSFDLVMFIDTLYTVADDGRAIKEAERLLIPGGYMLIMDGNYFLDMKLEPYQHRKEYFNIKYGFDEMLIKPEIRSIDYEKLRELAGSLHVNKVRRPGWEVWFTRGLGFSELHIYPRDSDGFAELTEYGRMNSPLTYTLVARKPLGQVDGVPAPEQDIPTAVFPPSDLDAGVFAALSNVDRIRILGCLLHKDMNVSEICAATGIAQNTVSYHLRLLKEGGLVTMDKRGREVVCGCADRGVALYLFNLARR